MITTLAEKKGGLRKLDKDSEAFNTFIAESRLTDIPTVNGLHTWNNKQGGNMQIISRLDRFEAFWTEHPTFMENINNWWTQTTMRSDNIMYIFQQKLKTIKSNLKRWNKDTFRDIFQAKKELEEKMLLLQQTMITKGHDGERKAQETNLQRQWEERLKQE
eukprot:PITA_06668